MNELLVIFIEMFWIMWYSIDKGLNIFVCKGLCWDSVFIFVLEWGDIVFKFFILNILWSKEVIMIWYKGFFVDSIWD